LKKANKNCEYICPHGNTVDFKISKKGWDNKKTVTASYCKNNCKLYMNGCDSFKSR